MKVVSSNSTEVEVKPQESPPIKLEETESSPTPLPQLHQDKGRPNEVDRAAAYQNPEVRDAAELVTMITL